MALFKAVVLDVWKQRRSEAGRLRADLERRVGDRQRREVSLEESFIYDRAIDRATYERHRDKLREEIALVRIEEEDARVEEIDVDGLLASVSTS
jgi:hypothetical protein